MSAKTSEEILSGLINPDSDSRIRNNPIYAETAVAKPIKSLSKSLEKDFKSIDTYIPVLKPITVNTSSIVDQAVVQGLKIGVKNDLNQQRSAKSIVTAVDNLSGIFQKSAIANLRQREEIDSNINAKNAKDTALEKLLYFKRRTIYNDLSKLSEKVKRSAQTVVHDIKASDYIEKLQRKLFSDGLNELDKRTKKTIQESTGPEEKEIYSRTVRAIKGIGSFLDKITPSLRGTVEKTERAKRGTTQSDNIYQNSFDTTGEETRLQTLRRTMFGEKGQFAGVLGMFEKFSKKDSGLTNVGEFRTISAEDKNNKAISTIIPNILSDILYEIKGGKGARSYYDWETGTYRNVADIEKADRRRADAKVATAKDKFLDDSGFFDWRQNKVLKFFQSNKSRGDLKQQAVDINQKRSDVETGNIGENNDFSTFRGSNKEDFQTARTRTSTEVYVRKIVQYFDGIVPRAFVEKVLDTVSNESDVIKVVAKEYERLLDENSAASDENWVKAENDIRKTYKKNILDKQDFRNININDDDDMTIFEDIIAGGMTNNAELELFKTAFKEKLESTRKFKNGKRADIEQKIREIEEMQEQNSLDALNRGTTESANVDSAEARTVGSRSIPNGTMEEPLYVKIVDHMGDTGAANNESYTPTISPANNGSYDPYMAEDIAVNNIDYATASTDDIVDTRERQEEEVIRSEELNEQTHRTAEANEETNTILKKLLKATRKARRRMSKGKGFLATLLSGALAAGGIIASLVSAAASAFLPVVAILGAMMLKSLIKPVFGWLKGKIGSILTKVKGILPGVIGAFATAAAAAFAPIGKFLGIKAGTVASTIKNSKVGTTVAKTVAGSVASSGMVQGATVGAKAVAGTVVGKKVSQATGKIISASKAATSLGGATVAKMGGRFASKLTPGLSQGISLGLAGERLWDGDLLGAALGVTSAIVSLVPIVGTVASLALDTVVGYRSMNDIGETPSDETKGIKVSNSIADEAMLRSMESFARTHGEEAFVAMLVTLGTDKKKAAALNRNGSKVMMFQQLSRDFDNRDKRTGGQVTSAMVNGGEPYSAGSGYDYSGGGASSGSINNASITGVTGGALGSLSKREESGTGGPGTVSSGKGDYGEVSYGSYQFASRGGQGSSVAKFLRGTKYGAAFKGLRPGSREFSRKWKEIAANDPEFGTIQHNFIKAKYFDKADKNISKKLGIDITTRSKALQDAVWSTAVQHGTGKSMTAKILQRGIRRAGLDPKTATDAEIISAIYTERGKKNVFGGLSYFKSSDAKTQRNVGNRFVREKAQALKNLALEKSGALKDKPAQTEAGSLTDTATTVSANTLNTPVQTIQTQTQESASQLGGLKEVAMSISNQTREIVAAVNQTTTGVGGLGKYFAGLGDSIKGIVPGNINVANNTLVGGGSQPAPVTLQPQVSNGAAAPSNIPDVNTVSFASA